MVKDAVKVLIQQIPSRNREPQKAMKYGIYAAPTEHNSSPSLNKNMTFFRPNLKKILTSSKYEM